MGYSLLLLGYNHATVQNNNNNKTKLNHKIKSRARKHDANKRHNKHNASANFFNKLKEYTKIMTKNTG